MIRRARPAAARSAPKAPAGTYPRSNKHRGWAVTVVQILSSVAALILYYYYVAYPYRLAQWEAKADASDENVRKFVRERAAAAAAASDTAAAAAAASDTVTSTTATPQQPPVVKIRSNLIDRNPLNVWDRLLEMQHDKAMAAEKAGAPLIAIEVGVHSPQQCIHAAEVGFQSHCFEPSPNSYRRALKGIDGQSDEIRKRIRLRNEAAGPTTGDKVPFKSTGGTGDHVGEFDMWNMEKHDKDKEMSAGERNKMGEIIEVPTIKLDDVVDEVGDVYLLKVDTQGFEPSVFAGLDRSIAARRAKYVIFEFWPRGMDLLGGTPDQCAGSKVIDKFVAAGYSLHALELEKHPKAPMKIVSRESRNRPFDAKSAEEYCRWFFGLEDKYPSENYKFGYWSDFLAVAPGEKLPQNLR